jgi:hypothetical protein
MENEVRDLGGEIDEILFNRGISYFFHYDKDFLKKYSPYQKIESLQGKLGTYFVGAYLNFESLENSAEYAKNLVFKYFD